MGLLMYLSVLQNNLEMPYWLQNTSLKSAPTLSGSHTAIDSNKKNIFCF